MKISGITAACPAGYQAAQKASSRKNWELTDALRETVEEYAREDAKRNVYMGGQFSSLRRTEAAKAAPDRAALIGKLSQQINSGTLSHMETIREADERWLCMLFGIPYKVERSLAGTGKGIHVYDENGDEILTYTDGVGWHEKESRAETQVHTALKSVYYEAYHAARQEIKDRCGFHSSS